jgi:hypothetical protein
VQFTVAGTNPCGAVQLDYGNGAAVVHAISELPATISYQYPRVGEYVIQAKGMGNCDGTASTNLRVARVRPQPKNPPPAPPPPPPSMRFKEMDENGDGVVTRAEWRGNLRSFDEHDWNGDWILSGDEVRVGAERPAGRGRGAADRRDTSVTAIVDSRDDWTDTGLDVRRGETLTINATGTIQFADRTLGTGPDGAAGLRALGGAPMPRELLGALVARVGRSAPFLVGARADRLAVPMDGPLYLRINDDVLDDNRGEFRVSISVTRVRNR